MTLINTFRLCAEAALLLLQGPQISISQQAFIAVYQPLPKYWRVHFCCLE